MTIAQRYAELLAELPASAAPDVLAGLIGEAHKAGAAGISVDDHFAALEATADDRTEE